MYYTEINQDLSRIEVLYTDEEKLTANATFLSKSDYQEIVDLIKWINANGK